MQTITKLVFHVETLPSGRKRTIYRKVIIKPTDPNYKEELKKKEEFLADKAKIRLC